MIVKVKLFAAAKQTLNRHELTLELADDATLAQLRQQLMDDFPALADLARRSMFAVDAKYGRDEDVLRAGDVVAWIPPVSGG